MTDNERRLAQALIDEAQRTAMERRDMVESVAYGAIASYAVVGLLLLVGVLCYLIGSMVGYHSDHAHWRRVLANRRGDFQAAVAAGATEGARKAEAELARWVEQEPFPPRWAVWIQRGRI